MTLTAQELAELYRRYGRIVERRCAKILGSAEDGRDAAHEAFARAVEQLRTFRGESERLAWLYRISTNVCLNVLRARRARGQGWLAELVERAPMGAVSGPEAVEHRQALERLFAEGEDELARALALLVYVDGLSQGEAATVMGISRATANARLGRLRERAQALAGGEA